MCRSDWQTLVDESTGNTYYFNPVTQETSWTNPNLTANDAAAWQTLVDAGSGATYYYNTVSGETSWDLPAALAASAAAGASPAAAPAASAAAPAAVAAAAPRAPVSSVPAAGSGSAASSSTPRRVRTARLRSAARCCRESCPADAACVLLASGARSTGCVAAVSGSAPQRGQEDREGAAVPRRTARGASAQVHPAPQGGEGRQQARSVYVCMAHVAHAACM
jgi:hypothetical protein